MKKLFLYIFSTLLLLANSHQVTAQNFSNIQQIHRQAGVAVSPVTPASVFVAGNLQSVLQRQYERRESMHIAAKKSSGASGERLKAFCGYNLLDTFASHPGKSDSAYYFYSSNRSSLFNFQKMAYLSPSVNTYTSPVDQNYPFALIYAPVQSPVISMDIMPDSVYAWNSYCPFGPSSGNIFGFADKVLNTYSGDLLTQTDNQYYPTLPGGKYRCQLNYDTLDNRISAMYYSYNSIMSSWEPTSIVCYTYNGLNQLVSDSSSVYTGAWVENRKSVYAYDINGNMTFTCLYADSSGFWQPQIRQYLVYNPDSTLQKDSTSQYNVGVWSAYINDSFGYTAGISYFTFAGTRLFSGDTVYASCEYLKNVSLYGLPDTVIYNYYGGYTAPVTQKTFSKKIWFTYDTYSNPLEAQSFNYVFSDSLTGAGYYLSSPERKYYYYYEPFDLTKVEQNIVSAGAITIFPNPASNNICLYRTDFTKGAATIIKIIDALGRIVITENLSWMNERETISLSGLKNGIYIISVQDANGQILKTQQLQKL